MMGAAGAAGAAGKTIFGWGSTFYIASNYRSSPVQIGDAKDWLDMVGGGSVLLAVKTDNTLWSWGYGTYGQRGDGTTTGATNPLLTPTQVGSLTDWESVSAGASCGYATKTDGTLWAWGINSSGQLGTGNDILYSSPVQIGSLTDWGGAIIRPTLLSVTVLKSNGTLWSWGNGQDGKLGDGQVANKSSPTQVGSLTTWTSLGAGETAMAAIKNDGTLWAWGLQSTYGNLGNNSTVNASSPVQIGSLTNWSKIGGHIHGWCAVKTDGTMWGVGKNEYIGAVGDSTDINRSSPVQVGALTNWSDLRGHRENTIALKTDGTLWAWGNANRGMNAQNNMIVYSSPVQIGSLTNWAFAGNGSGGASFSGFGVAE
tara:strand:- start:256 stop:1362 length:1107 start_codon:yes stop_codon:yes gene_type:complete